MSFIETPTRVEPCDLEEQIPEVLSELKSKPREPVSDLSEGFHPESAAEHRGTVRLISAYPSNLIEGDNAHPVAIEAALAVSNIDPLESTLVEEAIAMHAIGKVA